MAKKKRIKIGAMYREYGEMEGALCRDCCNFITITADGKRHCKCRAYGITREAIQIGTADMRRADCIIRRSIKSINRYLKEETSNEYTDN